MAITATPYLSFLVRQGNGNAVDLDTDTIKAALVADTYTPNLDTHDFWDDVVANEITAGDGYTAGGVTLTSPAITGNATNDRMEADYANVVWTFTAAKSIRYMVLYKSTGTDSTSALISLYDFGTTRSESAGFILNIPSTGLIQFRATTQST